MAELTLKIVSETKEELKQASNVLDISLTLKHPFKQKSKRNYTVKNDKGILFGQIRRYKSDF